MNYSIYHKTKAISNALPLEFLQGVTKQRVLLPYYHSITNSPKPHINNLGYYRTKDDFIRDLSFITKHYNSVPISELTHKNSKPVFHLSFDDGLSELYHEAVPFLVEKKIHATFFINSDFLDNKDLFYRHKIGVILEHIKQEADLKVVAQILEISTKYVFGSLQKLTFTDTQTINKIAAELKIDFTEYLNTHQPYLTTKQVKELQQLGFTIGNHGKSHLNFNSISFEEQQKQIKETNIVLKRDFSIDDLYFSFPFGDENIKNEFFNFMYHAESILLSFGTSVLKRDEHQQHLHRIKMEHNGYTAENIIKHEYFYYILKSFINKNIIKRNK